MAELRPNHAKVKLAAGEIVTALAGADYPDWIDFIGQTGIEAIWIEAEHGPVDFVHIGDLTRACDLWEMTSLVRVGRAEANVIYRTLDRGAQGIVVPHVDTPEQAKLVVDAAKFAPIGHRGVATNRQGFGVADYFEKANDQTMIVVLIEDIQAVRNLDAILNVDHIDVFHVAPSDLAQSMGHPAQADHPAVLRTVDESIAKILAAGRTAGMSVTLDTVGTYIRAGVRFFYHSIEGWILGGASQYLTTVRDVKTSA